MRASSSSSGVASPTHNPPSLDTAAVGRTLTQNAEQQEQTQTQLPPPAQPQQHQRRRSGKRQSSAEVRRVPLRVSEVSAPTSASRYRSSPHSLPPPPHPPARRQSPVNTRKQHRSRQSSVDSHRDRITNEESVSHRTHSVAGPIPSKGSSGRGVGPQRPHSSPTVHRSPQRLSATPTSVTPRSDSRKQTQLAYGVSMPQHRPPSFAGLQRDSTPDLRQSPPQSPPHPTSPLHHTQDSAISYTQDTDTHTRHRTMAEKGEEEITTEAVSPIPTLSLDKMKATWESEGQGSDSGGGRAESPLPPYPPPPSDAETPPPTSGNATATSFDRHHAEEAPSTAVPTAAASTDTHDARQHIHPHHHHPFMSNPMCDHPHHHHQHTKYSEESENEGKAKGVRNRSQFHHDDESVGATSRGSSSEGVPGPCSAAGPSGRTVTRLLIVGWDKTRTRIMIALLAIFVVWVCIFFPLLGQM